MKAILVIDIPDDMNVEETKALNVTLFNGLFVKELKIDCPLKPMPQKKGITVSMVLNQHYQDLVNYCGGWNNCIDTLLGETE